MADKPAVDNQVAYWQGELERAKKRFRPFWDNGDAVVDAYRQQKADGNDSISKDKYNILYSSTETIRPNLYAQSPTPRVIMRNKDSASPAARLGALLLEGCIKYVQDEEAFDEVMEGAVEDLLLPGLGNGWVRYDATFTTTKDEAGKEQQELLDEMVKLEYVYWQDMLYGIARTWKEMPWVARRCWMKKEDAVKRFGQNAANLKYAAHDSTARERDNPSETAEVWEIWDKRTKKVYWYAENHPELLDQKDDPLKLKKFFPCPRPMRAISNTRTFVPRALYSQYKSQAETLNTLTKRIRLLGEALRVVGLFDGSQAKLSDVLNPNAGNRMIAIDSWAMFAQNGGINGSVQWVPIDNIVKTLNELLKAREVCKQEIYEITGFSDIVRGVSKASETLGAQNIKADWAGARIKKMQADVQRFARDMLALATEVIAEHCGEATIAMFSGIEIPQPEEVRVSPEVQGKVQAFKAACDFIKSDVRRTATIDIETDSTLMANQEAERADRAQFLAAGGAFLQQAVPAMEATPELGPLLGAMLMFTARSFPSSRIIEDEFEKVQQALLAKASTPQADPKAAENEAKQAESALKQQELQIQQEEAKAKATYEQTKLQIQQQEEANRHAERMAELEIKKQELSIKAGELRVKEDLARTEKFKALHEAGMREEEAEAAIRDGDAQLAGKDADRELEAVRLADEATARDREAAQEAQEKAREGEGEGGEG